MDARLIDKLQNCKVRGSIVKVDDSFALRRALSWIYDMYYQGGIIGESALHLRARVWDFLSTSMFWICEDSGEIVGSISLIKDTDSKLPCDYIVPQIMDDLREKEVLGCASNFCAAYNLGAFARLKVIAQLIIAAYDAALEEGITYVVAAVSPKQVAMLEDLCGFSKLFGPTLYPNCPFLVGSGSPTTPDIVEVVGLRLLDGDRHIRLLREIV